MIDLKERVHTALEGMEAEIIFGWPMEEIGGECVLWRESGNRRYAQADGAEYLAEVQYTMDIFARSAERAAEIVATVDARMTGIRLRREACAQQFERETGWHHVSVRYRALADVRGGVYQ